MSGTNDKCFAVSKEGRVFELNCIFLATVSFRQIPEFDEYTIRAVYAGFNHSLFETSEGEILSRGYGNDGQLLINELPASNNYNSLKTNINSGASFCVAGNTKRVVFIESTVPTNPPNRPI